jgi:hypothetical protein
VPLLQVRAIHSRECITFSTKERVPLLVCLEVRAVELSELTASSSVRRVVGRSSRTSGTTGGEDMSSLMDALKEKVVANIASLRGPRSTRELSRQVNVHVSVVLLNVCYTSSGSFEVFQCSCTLCGSMLLSACSI